MQCLAGGREVVPVAAPFGPFVGALEIYKAAGVKMGFGTELLGG
mgnify:CR=1 FL=1